MLKTSPKRAQSLIEFTVLIVLVLAGIILMGPYMIRSINAHMKSWQDSVASSLHEQVSCVPIKDGFCGCGETAEKDPTEHCPPSCICGQNGCQADCGEDQHSCSADCGILPYCEGGATSCSAYDEFVCNVVSGCTWFDYGCNPLDPGCLPGRCTGAALCINQLDRDSCDAAHCTWVE